MSRKYCHEMIAKVAKEFAHTQYAEFAKTNWWYAANPDETSWVNAMWSIYIEPARATLVEMLSRPISDILKDQIADALIKDNDFRAGNPLRKAISGQH